MQQRAWEQAAESSGWCIAPMGAQASRRLLPHPASPLHSTQARCVPHPSQGYLSRGPNSPTRAPQGQAPSPLLPLSTPSPRACHVPSWAPCPSLMTWAVPLHPMPASGDHQVPPPGTAYAAQYRVLVPAVQAWHGLPSQLGGHLQTQGPMWSGFPPLEGKGRGVSMSTPIGRGTRVRAPGDIVLPVAAGTGVFSSPGCRALEEAPTLCLRAVPEGRPRASPSCLSVTPSPRSAKPWKRPRLP